MPRRDPAARFSRRISVDHAPSAPAFGTFPPATQISWPRNAADTLAPPVFGRMPLGSLTRSGPAARRDLLRVLTSPNEVRADVIRQLHERPDGQEMADLLIFLEEWEWARQGMIEELSRA